MQNCKLKFEPNNQGLWVKVLKIWNYRGSEQAEQVLFEIDSELLRHRLHPGMIAYYNTAASVLCSTTIKNEDKMEFSKVLEAINKG
ncbi:60S ribosomal protein L7a-2-like [Rosa chinensis]|uniref:60S ribosomal protein L7a-2-like n=1 Tax=Rosa chinensis TaxID=74649 RepID=UPI001AD8B8E4|nr:60S ribosomal protein L7a-2-like [Rosa chinensis]